MIGRTLAGFGKVEPRMNGMDADEEVRNIRARPGWAGRWVEERAVFNRGILEIRGRGREDEIVDGMGLIGRIGHRGRIGSNAVGPLARPDNTDNSTFMGVLWHGFGESAFQRYGRFFEFSRKSRPRWEPLANSTERGCVEDPPRQLQPSRRGPCSAPAHAPMAAATGPASWIPNQDTAEESACVRRDF